MGFKNVLNLTNRADGNGSSKFTKSLNGNPLQGMVTVQVSITPESLTSRYNNFYEFTMDKSRVRELAGALPSEDWTIRVEGLVKKPGVLNVESLIRKMRQEERTYRLRCG